MSFVLNKVSSLGKLEDISLEVNDGEILVIYGPEGGGKDEIFRVITAEIPLDSGEIILNGKAIKTIGDAGTIFEDYIIYKRRVKKGIYIFSYRRWLKRVDEKKLDIVSEIMGMDKKVLLSPAVCHLSKGERKRFDLARYLITKRDLILLDDPLIGLDWPHGKSALINLKEIILRFNQPCLYKANSERECKGLRCRVAIVRNGRVEYCGEWREGLNF